MSEEVVCKRCGLCCHIILKNDKGKEYISNKLCRFLLFVGNNRYICKIYKCENRIGHDIGNGNKCHKRTDFKGNYINCPYNKLEYGKELGVGDYIEEEKE